MLGGGTYVYQAAPAQIGKTIRTILGPAVSTIAVPAAPAGEVVNNVTVHLAIDFPNPADLAITLIAPNGTRIPLVTGVYDSYARRNFANTTFSDLAPNNISTASVPYTGIFRPQTAGTPLADLFGINPQGNWQLEVTPTGNQAHIGTLQSWSLEIQTGIPTNNPTANPMDQDGDSFAGQHGGTATGGLAPGGDMYAIPRPSGYSWNGTYFQPNFDANTSPISIPGPHLVRLPYVNATAMPVPPVGVGGTGTANDITTSTIVVNDQQASSVVSNLTVTVRIQHPTASDLIITLIAPDGTRILLADREGTAGANYWWTTFDDAATNAIRDGTAPFDGAFKPVTPLAGLNGKVMNGTWTLEIEDAGAGANSNGTLVSWELYNKEELHLNAPVSYVNVTFDRNMNPATFTRDDLVTMSGALGQINGPHRYDSAIGTTAIAANSILRSP